MKNYVLTKRGLIEESQINLGEEIYTINGYEPVETINTNMVDCSEITLENGLTLTTNNQIKTDKDTSHACILPIFNNDNKFEVPLNFYEYQILTSGNLSNRLKTDVVFPKTLNSDLAYFLGYSYGDGYVENDLNKPSNICLSCSDDYPEITKRLTEIMNSFNVNVRSRRGCGALDVISFCNRIIMYNLQQNEILKQKAGSLIFPEKILTAPPDIQMAFFDGFFDADGCAQQSKKSLKISIVDKEFLQVFQIILLTMGVVTTFGKNTKNNVPNNWKPQFRLNITGENSVNLIKKLSNSHKIMTSKFMTIRDSNVTIYKSEDFDAKYYNYKFCNNKDNLSLKSFVRLQQDNAIPVDAMPFLRKQIIETNPTKKICYSLQTKSPYWCNGFIVNP